MARTIFDLDSIIEYLSGADYSKRIDTPFDPEGYMEKANDCLQAELEAAGLRLGKLANAVDDYAAACDTAGFARGFRAGARMVQQVLQGECL